MRSRSGRRVGFLLIFHRRYWCGRIALRRTRAGPRARQPPRERRRLSPPRRRRAAQTIAERQPRRLPNAGWERCQRPRARPTAEGAADPRPDASHPNAPRHPRHSTTTVRASLELSCRQTLRLFSFQPAELPSPTSVCRVLMFGKRRCGPSNATLRSASISPALCRIVRVSPSQTPGSVVAWRADPSRPGSWFPLRDRSR